jgi:hypothetical protein
MKFPNKLYEALTAEERSRAFVEAVARHDGDELDRLNDTCPRHQYECEDANYVRMRLNTWLISLIVHQDASYYAELAGAATTLSMKYDDERFENLTMAVQTSIRRYRQIYQAFDRFCDHIGISPAVMRKAYLPIPHPMMAVAEGVFGHLEDAQPDEAEVVVILESLKDIWKKEL